MANVPLVFINLLFFSIKTTAFSIKILSFFIEISGFFIEILSFSIEILSFFIEMLVFFIKILSFFIEKMTFFIRKMAFLNASLVSSPLFHSNMIFSFLSPDRQFRGPRAKNCYLPATRLYLIGIYINRV